MLTKHLRVLNTNIQYVQLSDTKRGESFKNEKASHRTQLCGYLKGEESREFDVISKPKNVCLSTETNKQK